MPRGIEPEVKEHFFKVGYSFFAGFLWLLVNVTLGLFFGFAIVEKQVSLVNILFYIWFLVSILLLFFYLRKKWKHLRN